ncbi:MAG TPA: hybrid sensor histidine kinase/response regulator [Polyangiaceae bacterium]|nr:hybrid sensor histidine kinase/response regulator [Polyangiaceae bacterium]
MPSPAPPAATVLVVDDHEPNRALAQGTLEDEGYRVVTADDGLAGVAAFERERPDCVVLDIRMPGLDGFEACARIRALPGGDDVPVVFVTALRDVDAFDEALKAGGDDFLTKPVRPTELLLRVQAALKLRRLRAERHGLYEVLRQQRDDLLRASLAKERLTAFLVHDLKNPVNAMALHAQLILRDAKASASSREAAASIVAESSALGRMIVNLLDISKADEGRLAPAKAPVDLGALVGEVLEALGPRAREADVELGASVEAAGLEADADLVRRVLENLVENAIRHAPSRTTVRVSVARRGGAVELRVADAGRGVPPGLRDRIFERFVQGEGGPASSRAGRGLGLAFCKLAAEAHGGRVWVEDGSPGAVFCVSLPAGP